jgi:hypothetical protein
MKYIAAILIVGGFIRHNSSLWLQDLTGVSVKAIFFILGGAWEAILALVIVWLLWNLKRNAYWHLAVMGCVLEIVEGSQIAVCRMLATPGKGNLCDILTGVPVGATLTAFYSVILCYFLGGEKMTNVKIYVLVPVLASAEVAYLTNPLAGLVLLAVSLALWSRHGIGL